MSNFESLNKREMVKTLKLLKDIHPDLTEKIDQILLVVSEPYRYVCQLEAEFQLDEILNDETSRKTYPDLPEKFTDEQADALADRLFNSEDYISASAASVAAVSFSEKVMSEIREKKILALLMQNLADDSMVSLQKSGYHRYIVISCKSQKTARVEADDLLSDLETPCEVLAKEVSERYLSILSNRNYLVYKEQGELQVDVAYFKSEVTAQVYCEERHYSLSDNSGKWKLGYRKRNGTFFRYYSIAHPLAPGCIPCPDKALQVKDFDEKVFCNMIGEDAWGYVDYPESLTEEQYKAYELIPEGMKPYWCVTSTIHDDDTSAAITSMVRAMDKPENGFISLRDKDIYTDWFDSIKDAEEFIKLEY